ncbi:MAG: hypothetical protein VKJ24_00035 [Synechococcales bacterium]|nr:hypothetical protein [Synechococcales bacterium]
MLRGNFVNWKALIRQIAIWIVMELLLDIAGLSQLATYSEFLENQLEEMMSASITNIIYPEQPLPPACLPTSSLP